MAGPEITPRRRALLVTLHHGIPQIGLNGLPYENKNLKQLTFNVLLRKPELQRRKPRNLDGERSSGSTKSIGQSIHEVLMPGDMLNILLYP